MNTATEIETKIFVQARRLFALGYSARQISKKLDLLPSQITKQACLHNWPAGPKPDWAQLRSRFESGEEITQIAKTCTVSLSTLQKRKLRENWSRNHTSGIDALRRAVAALENALANAPDEDAVLTMRISTALSMAAGRLSRAEKGLAPIDDELDGEPELVADDEQAAAELSRLLRDWRVEKDE